MQINSHTHTYSTPATCHQQVNGANNKKIVDKKRTSINGKNTCSWSSKSRMSVCVCASRNGSLALPMHCPIVDRQQQQCVYLICQAKMPPAFYLCPLAIFPSIFVRERTWRERESTPTHTHVLCLLQRVPTTTTRTTTATAESCAQYSWLLEIYWPDNDAGAGAGCLCRRRHRQEQRDFTRSQHNKNFSRLFHDAAAALALVVSTDFLLH